MEVCVRTVEVSLRGLVIAARVLVNATKIAETAFSKVVRWGL
jgi:hypothetical protein